MEAAAFHLFGATKANFTEWGGWKRKTQARYYAKAVKSCTLLELFSLSYQEHFSEIPSRETGGASI